MSFWHDAGLNRPGVVPGRDFGFLERLSMAIGWLTVLQSVPWADMVSHAPKVASGARKLWDSVGKNAPEAPKPAARTRSALPAEAQSLGALQSRIDELESAFEAAQGHMTASSGLINELAAQNKQLIVCIETQRRRLGWLAGLLAVTGLMAAGSLALGLMR